MKVNLISDTTTNPTEKMLQSMIQAEVGDDVFQNDPTVNLLQTKASTMFGMEDALFFPSGTMSNQTAIKLHTQPGDKLFCDKWAHIFNSEGGGVAANSGVTSGLIDGNRGVFTTEQLQASVSDTKDIHEPLSRLVCIENTANKGGGTCWDFNELQKIKKICTQYNLQYHLDGARLFNALVAKNETPKQYGELFDTISICLSKGLGAPVGSLLLGNHIHIAKALRIRKMLGGGMRQAGYLAAAGIYALDNHVERLAEDHQRAQYIGSALQSCSFIKNIEPIETNIVIFYVQDDINIMQFLQTMKEKDIHFISIGEGKLRMVTHLDFTDAMLEYLVHELQSV